IGERDEIRQLLQILQELLGGFVVDLLQPRSQGTQTFRVNRLGNTPQGQILHSKSLQLGLRGDLRKAAQERLDLLGRNSRGTLLYQGTDSKMLQGFPGERGKVNDLGAFEP